MQSRFRCRIRAGSVYNRAMPVYLRAPLALASIALLAACAGVQEAQPDADSLQASFAEQIAAVGGVGDFERDGTELTFSGPDGGGGQTAWRVSIDSVVVAAQEDETYPYRGNILSSWYADGESIEPVGSMSNLPSDFLDAGIAQDCWGLWAAAESRWTW